MCDIFLRTMQVTHCKQRPTGNKWNVNLCMYKYISTHANGWCSGSAL